MRGTGWVLVYVGVIFFPRLPLLGARKIKPPLMEGYQPLQQRPLLPRLKFSTVPLKKPQNSLETRTVQPLRGEPQGPPEIQSN